MFDSSSTDDEPSDSDPMYQQYGKFGREIPNLDDETFSPHYFVFNVAQWIDRPRDEKTIQLSSGGGGLELIKEHEEIGIKIGNQIVSAIEVYLLCIRKMLERKKMDRERPIVIAVPDYFQNQTRALIKNRVCGWGFNGVQVLSESVLSFYAYNLVRPFSDVTNILYLDSYKIVKYSIDDGVAFREWVHHFDNLGEEIIQGMVEYYSRLFKRQHFQSLNENPLSMIKLRNACEDLIDKLSEHESYHFHIPKLYNNIDFNMEMSRSTFEELNQSTFEKYISEIYTLIRNGIFQKIVFCGKLMKIPKLINMIRNLLMKELPNMEWYESIEHPVSVGAAAYGFLMNNPHVLINDLTCLNIGIQNENGEMSVIAARNSVMPSVKSQIISLPILANQHSISIDVFEGNRKYVKDCLKTGTLKLDIPKNHPYSTFQVEVIFELFLSTNFHMIATARSVQYESEDSFIPSSGSILTSKEIEEMIQMATSFNDDDLKTHNDITPNLTMDQID